MEAQTVSPMPGMPRFPSLDGWRAISILLVLGGHLFPLGPKVYLVNEGIATLGMAIFFTLSGFLITTTLLYRPSVSEFLIRRLCRIVPLAWLFTIIALTIAQAPSSFYLAQLLFYSNLPPFPLTQYTGHLWSLCAEMQFYVGIAAIFFVFGQRGLWSIPVLCLLVTAHRIQQHELVSIVTSVRVDEILAGGTLALVCNTPHLPWIRKFLAWVSPFALVPFAIAASNTLSGGLDYLRPYVVTSMVGSTLLYIDKPAVTRHLEKKWLAIKYAKRIPELAAIFGLAHLSTFYFEDFWIRKGKDWS